MPGPAGSNHNHDLNHDHDHNHDHIHDHNLAREDSARGGRMAGGEDGGGRRLWLAGGPLFLCPEVGITYRKGEDSCLNNHTDWGQYYHLRVGDYFLWNRFSS